MHILSYNKWIYQHKLQSVSWRCLLCRGLSLSILPPCFDVLGLSRSDESWRLLDCFSFSSDNSLSEEESCLICLEFLSSLESWSVFLFLECVEVLSYSFMSVSSWCLLFLFLLSFEVKLSSAWLFFLCFFSFLDFFSFLAFFFFVFSLDLSSTVQLLSSCWVFWQLLVTGSASPSYQD